MSSTDQQCSSIGSSPTFPTKSASLVEGGDKYDTRIDDKREDYLVPERPPKRNHPTQLLSDNVFAFDVENPNSTDYWNLLLASKLRTVSRKTERMPRGTRRKGNLLYSDQNIFKENQARQKTVAMVWIDNKKVYDKVPQSWLVKYLKM